MTLGKIYDLNLLNDDTEIFVRGKDMQILAHGNWYQDNVLDYWDYEIETFTWQDDNKVYADVKQK